jgi:predicted transcriptional regulator
MLELMLSVDGTVVLRAPLYPVPLASLRSLELTTQFSELAEIFSVAANEKRLRVMIELLKRPETRFTDLLQVAVNPKLVRDCLGPMMRAGLVTHAGKGSAYLLSGKGRVVVSTLTEGVTGILRAAEEGKI